MSKQQRQLDFGPTPPCPRKIKPRGSSKAVELDPRRFWSFYCPSPAEVAEVEAMERAKREGAGHE